MECEEVSSVLGSTCVMIDITHQVCMCMQHDMLLK